MSDGDDAEEAREPRPVRNFLIFAIAALMAVVGMTLWIEAKKEAAEEAQEAALYMAITNAVHRAVKEAQRVAPIRQFQTRRTGMNQVTFAGWVEVGATGTVRREFEARVRDNYLTNGPVEVIGVQIRGVIP